MCGVRRTPCLIQARVLHRLSSRDACGPDLVATAVSCRSPCEGLVTLPRSLEEEARIGAGAGEGDTSCETRGEAAVCMHHDIELWSL